MNKEILTEQAIYHGEITLPKGYEIDPSEMSQNILKSFYSNKKSIASKFLDQLNTYIRDNFELRNNIKLISKQIWGDIFSPNEKFTSLSTVNPVDLKNSPDFVCLYGINTLDCTLKIFYDDNRRKGRSWKIPLKQNTFVMFPATNAYTITNNQKSSLNFIQTITYEYI